MEDSSEETVVLEFQMLEQPDFLLEHDYSVRQVDPRDLPALKSRESSVKEDVENEAAAEGDVVAKKFAKCDKCRRSRTKVLVPKSLLSVTVSKNDGVTCDFCGDVMGQATPQTLPDMFEGRRGSKGGDYKGDPKKLNMRRKKNYVYCGECGKVVLKESLTKHLRDVHEKSNKRRCTICNKLLSGPFSLKEHISAVHNKVARHKCPQCEKVFAHFSNMNRHIRLVHEKMVVTHKYVNCGVCNKVVQMTSLKKHMSAIHEQRRDFKCEYCSKGFAQSYTLREHIAAKHTFTYSHSCKLCGKKFAHKTNCGRHLRNVHKKEVESEMQDGELIKEYITTSTSRDEDDPTEDPAETMQEEAYVIEDVGIKNV